MASADNVVLNIFVYMILTVTFRGFREEISPTSLDNIPEYDAGRSFRNSAAYPYFQNRLRHSTQCTLDSSQCLSAVLNWRATPVLICLRPVFLWNRTLACHRFDLDRHGRYVYFCCYYSHPVISRSIPGRRRMWLCSDVLMCDPPLTKLPRYTTSIMIMG